MASNAPETNDKKTPAAFTPYRLRGLTLPNRIVMSPLCMYAADDGAATDFHVVHLGSRAVGGAGLVIAEMSAVHPDGRLSIRDAGIWEDRHIEPWKRVVDFVHEHSDAKIGLQLGHAGRKADTGLSWKRDSGIERMGFDLIAPSAIPFRERYPVPRAMSGEEIETCKKDYFRATERALEAGFDMIELHCAHGYLLSTFISPISNKRDDSYGGSLENRMRLPLEILDGMRKIWPDDKPIAARISAVDWSAGGTTIEDAVKIGRLFKQAGLDILDVSSGMVTPDRPEEIGLFQTPFSERIRSDAGIPTMTVGNIATAAQMNDIIDTGKADLCAIGRGHMYDPYFALHAAREADYEMTWPDRYARGRHWPPPN
jgi:anthraniloyl-CoA monooxygenase